jgi:glycosyltransferase involved in cell wall biosynthesis
MSARADDARRPRVLHVTNIPTPYRLPQYRAFRAALASRGVDLVIYFIGAGKRPRQWQIPEEEFDGIERIEGDPRASVPRRTWGITRAIDRMRPDVVVLAWAMDLTALLVLLHCRSRRIPCVVYTGETDAAAAQRSYPAVREAFRRLFLRSADGFVVYGASAARYLGARGVDERRISTAINVVDTAFFRERVDELRAGGEADALRDRHRRPDGGPFALHLLFVGELIELKGLPLLLDAMARTEASIALHLVGDGPQETELRALVSGHGIGERVFFHGYRQKPELPLYYAMADAFVFTSLKDVFGLVMVEGAAAALPVIGSSMAGGSIDVVVPDVTGYIVDPRDIAALAAAITKLAADPERRRAMGEASRAHALEHLTPEVSARGYVAAIERLLEPTNPVGAA